MTKISVIASASGSGKTTVGRALAERLDVPFVELDALVHGPNGSETLRGALWGRDALLPYALRAHFRNRRTYPERLTRYPVVRLRSPSAVEAFLTGVAP